MFHHCGAMSLASIDINDPVICPPPFFYSRIKYIEYSKEEGNICSLYVHGLNQY